MRLIIKHNKNKTRDMTHIKQDPQHNEQPQNKR